MVKEKRILSYFIGWLVLGLIVCFVGITNVNAEVLYDYEFKILNRDYSQIPFNVKFNAGESTTYADGKNYIKLYGINDNLVNLPKFMYVIYCGTEPLNFNTISVNYGDLSNYNHIQGGKCEIKFDNNYYSANYYLNRWQIKSWGDISSSGVYSYGIDWNINITNNLSKTVYYNIQSIFLSNEIITDFSSDYLLSQILQQNAEFKNQLNSIEDSQDSINSGIGETNEKLDTTNKELEDVNDNIGQTNDKLDNLQGALTDSSPTDMSGLGNSAGWLPAGPVDSILTLPLTMLNNLVNNLSSSSCQTAILQLPYVKENINLPCIKTLYDKIGITGTLFQSAGIIASAFILFNYLLKLYQWVDNTLTMRENTMPGYFEDNWGGGA